MKNTSKQKPNKIGVLTVFDNPPFIQGAVMAKLPKGLKIVGNGTLPNPLSIVLTGPYAVASELLIELEKLLLFVESKHGHKDGDIYQDAAKVVTKAKS